MVRSPVFLSAMVALPLIGALSVVGSARGQEPAKQPKPETAKAGALDIIAADAVAALAIGNVSQLIKRGDEFIDKTKADVPFRLSMGYLFVVGHLGLTRGLDDEGAAALMLLKKEGDLESLVLAAPVGDFTMMAANFKLRREDLAEGKIVDRQLVEGKEVPPYARYVAVRGSHLLMGGKPDLLELAVKAKPLSGVLPEEDRATLAQDDVLLYGNARPFKGEWTGVSRDLERELAKLAADDADALRKLIEATPDLQYALGGLRLEDGLGASIVMRYEGEKSREILTGLQGGKPGNTTLAGLPLGNTLAAHASSGDGDNSAALARALLHWLMQAFAADTDRFVSAGHRPNVVGVFGEVWQRLDGSRSALYENESPDRDGMFSLVAVLDTDDAPRFLADMTDLARFVNASTLSADDDSKIDDKTIAELIAKLGHDEFQVRQTATTKLRLVGPPALPALEAAAESADAEVRFRARAVREQINKVLAEEREGLAKGDLLSQLKPNFAWFPRHEMRGGQSVDVVELRLEAEDAAYAAQLHRLLGPEWRKLRLVAVGNRVVVLFGSNTALLDTAIGNVKAGEAALQGDPRYAPFRARNAAESTAEFHLSLARLMEAATPDAEQGAAVSSLGLSIVPQRVRADLFSPYEDVKTLIRRFGF